ncbi:phosphatidate cytidylyltransferase [Sphingomonas jejuensis]|uniref:Phosphatidate cytidylyltransferase n=1 Tax=Sphingomonas jejuensis TaxID=904715 RepID=A0ABX0XL41_9SPHN|nr:phosphatidate cytidylyltransferase [Sphingomonas jejuensis]NJC33512.1 phosphatidate cytidylyltransferase [Sphingomonas jejuensis]
MPGIRRNWIADLPRKALVAAILIALAWICLSLGGAAFWLLICVASILMMAEWAELARAPRGAKRIALYALVVPLAILAPDPIAAGPSWLVLGLIGGATIFVGAVTRHPQLALGIPYVALPAVAVLWLRELPGGLAIAFWTMATVWATDIGAYFAGRLIGGPKLMPRVSPNKTWAGLIGGMAAALLVGLAFNERFGVPIELVLTAPVLAIIAQAGDLYESSIKRRAGVKDSGTLLPGHGGVLDRLDGLVTVAPAVALLLLLKGLG